MDLLPNELIYKIINYLNFKELYYKRTTNKIFFEAYTICYNKLLSKHIKQNTKNFLKKSFYKFAGYQFIDFLFNPDTSFFTIINISKFKSMI